MAETPARKIANPTPSLDSQPYWDALNEGKLLIKRCGSCERPHHYPRGLCPHCASSDTRWEETDGTGEIYSLSVTRRGPGAPYALAYVTLAEGVSLLTNVVECDFDSLKIGERVRLSPITSEGGQALPCFTPDR